MAFTYIRPRGDTKANWASANPVLKVREMGIEWESKVGEGKAKIKFGDGTTAWKNLDYAVNEASIITSNTKSGWSSSNPVLGKNEIGLEYASTVGTGEVNIKVGDGTKAWNSLGYSFNNDITNKPIKSITTSSAENPSLAANDTLAVVAGKLNKQQSFLKTKLGYERLNSLASALGGLSNNDFVGAMEKLNSLKFDKTSVYNGTDSSSTTLAASANVARSLKSSIDTLNQNIYSRKNIKNNATSALDISAETSNIEVIKNGRLVMVYAYDVSFNQCTNDNLTQIITGLPTSNGEICTTIPVENEVSGPSSGYDSLRIGIQSNTNSLCLWWNGYFKKSKKTSFSFCYFTK